MPGLFENEAFALTSLTAAINNTPYKPARLARMGLFDEDGITTTSATIELRDGKLGLVDVVPRGGVPSVVQGNSHKVLTFGVPHLPARASIRADEVQGVRAFGSESESEVLQTVIDRRLASMRASLDYTLEYHRLLAVTGKYMDNNGKVTDLCSEFGQKASSVSFALSKPETDVHGKVDVVLDLIACRLGRDVEDVVVLCGKTFWSNLIKHPNVEKLYLNHNAAASLRGGSASGFEFGGLRFIRYRGTDEVAVKATEAYAFASDVSDLFITRFAPADYVETVNTIGLPYYAKSEPMGMGKGVALEAQSNPINLCTRPQSIIKLTG